MRGLLPRERRPARLQTPAGRGKQLWQSAAKTPALGAAPTAPQPHSPLPSQPVPHGVITVTSYCLGLQAARAASVSVLN